MQLAEHIAEFWHIGRPALLAYRKCLSLSAALEHKICCWHKQLICTALILPKWYPCAHWCIGNIPCFLSHNPPWYIICTLSAWKGEKKVLSLSINKLQFTEYWDNRETCAAALVVPSCDIEANQNAESIASEIRHVLADLWGNNNFLPIC